MKNILLLSIIIVTMSMSKCDKQSFDKKPPVKITEKSYQNWYGGIKGAEGFVVTLQTEIPSTNIAFDSIYFNNKAIKINTKKETNHWLLTAKYAKPIVSDDLIISSDPKQEYGNKAPVLEKKIPFELKENQAIISYILNDEKRYFTLENIKKKADIFYR